MSAVTTSKIGGLFAGRIYNLAKFLFLTAQLGALAIIMRQFQVVSSAFLRVALIAFAGFAVNYFLPARYRLPFFFFLSLAGIAVVMGPTAGTWVIGLGLLIVAVCHLPVPFAARVGLLVLIGTLFAMMRVDWISVPWPQAIWPVLGSMFMFRVIVYLYDVRHANAPASFWHSLCYFFMLPNVCFPLFPVVDYQKFHNNYYDQDEYRIYQVGVDWMVRGVIHLILYRVVYYYMTLGPSEVATPENLAQFMLTTFLLYLKVSGQFHIVVGMLHLFGFNLPETNNRYLLAPSFTDFWRRINIYWKDFMMKIFYYPLYFELRRFGTFTAIVVCTLFVFLVTWLLHSYQWFWLRGSFPIIWQDGVYWTILAVLVAANALYEIKFGRKRTLKKSVWSTGSQGKRAVTTIATLAVICILWSLWTTDTLSGWLALWTVFSLSDMAAADIVPAGLAAGLILGTWNQGGGAEKGILNWFGMRRSTLGTLGSLFALFLIGIPAVYTQFGADIANVVVTLRSDKLNRLDAATLERGYYEDLIQVKRFNSELWELYMNMPLKWLDVRGSGLTRFTDGFAQKELIRSAMVSMPFGTISTNRWGMRDQDYEQTPAPGTYRIAVLGASVEMGWGVGDGQTFEAVLERRLNEELTGEETDSYEILNFGVPGYRPLQQVSALEKAFSFAPNAVYYMAHGRELSRAAFYLADVIRKEIEIPYDRLREIARRAGVEPDMAESEILRRLGPHKPEILSWLYNWIVDECRKRDVLTVLIFLPQTEGGTWEEETPQALSIAEDAGFAVLDLRNVFEGHDRRSLQLAEWDRHPNARGHQIMADRIYQALRERQDVFFPHLGASPQPATKTTF